MIKNTITDILSAIGIKNVGFCAFSSVKEHLLECRAKARIPKGAKTVIICAFPYRVKEEPPKFLSRYAAVTDYHTVVGNLLESVCQKLRQQYKENQFEWFCDNSPIPEVHTAAEAGLGIKGDNGLLITKEYGSFVFLGEIVTDIQIDCKSNYQECNHCGKCKSICPIALEKQNCLSNLSQKKKLTDGELEILKDNKILWGCDICQNACPLNKSAQNTDISEFINGYRDEYVVGEDTVGRPYTWRGEEVINRNAKNLTDLPNRRPMRLKNYDYSTEGYYFITICTENRKEILSKIVGTGVLDCPKIQLSQFGEIANKRIIEMKNFYDNILVDKYVIMPNHIHMLINITKNTDGQSGTPVPTMANSTISKFISTFKRFCNKEYGQNIWQARFYDHVICGEQDYNEIWEYIENNPARWQEDEFYSE